MAKNNGENPGFDPPSVKIHVFFSDKKPFYKKLDSTSPKIKKLLGLHPNF